jgi:prepilin peptidase CpaA
MPIEQYLDVVLLLLVSIAAVNDLATRRIPNRLLLAGLAARSAAPACPPIPALRCWPRSAAWASGLAVFLPFYLVRGMAAGDVKMMAVVGAFTGPGEAFEIAVLTWCAGGVMALLLVLLRGRLRLVAGQCEAHAVLGAISPGSGATAPLAQPARLDAVWRGDRGRDAHGPGPSLRLRSLLAQRKRAGKAVARINPTRFGKHAVSRGFRC